MKLLILLLIAVCAIAQVVEFADCELRPIGNSGVSGYVRFTRDSSSPLVTVNAMVNGIPSGTPSVAIHVHNWGDVSDTAAGNSAGGHYVGAGSTTHACPPAAVRHEGDMGNWNVSGSSISGSKTLDLLTMTGAFSILGRAVIVHAKADDCVTQPTGAAGSRLAQCVIGLGNMTTIGATGSNAAAVSAGTSPLTLAVCDLTSSTSSLTDPHGSVYFQVQNDGVRILGKFTGVNGTHGLHVHTSGDLSMANFVSAGGHWNPKNVSHGLPPHSRHAGDLGNVQTYDGSTAWYDWVNPDFKDLESLIGRAVIFHATFDHGAGYGCDQAGSAGSRMLSCVIGVGNATAVVLPTPPPVDNKYKDVDCSARPKKKKNRTGVIVGLSVTFGVLLIVIVVAVILVKCVWQSSSSMGDASYQSLSHKNKEQRKGS